MRKVFLIMFFVFGIALTNPVGSKAESVVSIGETVSGEEYIYIKVCINGVDYIIVYTSDGAVIDIYPDSGCGNGGHHGGPH